MPISIRIGCEVRPGTNILAFFAIESVTKKKSFKILTPGVNVIKHFVAVI
jgi:hypothetical protein